LKFTDLTTWGGLLCTFGAWVLKLLLAPKMGYTSGAWTACLLRLVSARELRVGGAGRFWSKEVSASKGHSAFVAGYRASVVQVSDNQPGIESLLHRDETGYLSRASTLKTLFHRLVGRDDRST